MRMETENQLKLVQNSYDEAIELGKKGIDRYKDLPEYITKDPDYPAYKKWTSEGVSAQSGRKEIRDYLSPKKNMKFIDLGCSLNLMFRGYDKWPSFYYGVDISSNTIHLLNDFIKNKELCIGSLHCGSIHETPFEANFFDIGACIGVLEYYEKDFVAKAILEVHRIMKPNGRFVLDIPNIGNPTCRIMKLIEEHLRRPDKFDMSPTEFEEIVKNSFDIEKTDDEAMVHYYLTCRK